jgi:transcriptional regulator with XRE-family HTH domain
MPRILGPDGPDALDLAMGQRLKARRRDLGLSQQALAEAVGITFQQLQKYERGVNRISFSRLAALARALDCRVGDLAKDLDAPAPPPSVEETAAYLDEPGAADLLRAYATLSDDLRQAVLSHARELADIARRVSTKA